jgi:chromosome segregation ATPase
VADYLSSSVAKVDAAAEEHWALAKSGAGLVDPPGRTDNAAKALEKVQADLLQARGADRARLVSREAELASQLRSFRHLEVVSAQISSHLSDLSAQLEGVVASAGELVASAGAAGADLSSLASELTSLTGALDEARRIMATPPPS